MGLFDGVGLGAGEDELTGLADGVGLGVGVSDGLGVALFDGVGVGEETGPAEELHVPRSLTISPLRMRKQ